MPEIRKRRIDTPRAGSARIIGGFWEAKQRVNRETTLPIEYQQLSSTHRLEVLKGWDEGSGYEPHIFWDSDVAKWLEAAAYSLQSYPDGDLEARCDEVIEDLARLQGDDGYLNSFFSQVEPEGRWTNLRDRHELYCAGHLIEAAVAYSEATGKRKFLDVMSRYADYIASVFGEGEGKKKGYPGHEEIELALIKLYRTTGNATHLRLSKFFLDMRGTDPHYYDEEATARGDEPTGYRFGNYDYLQAHLPVRKQDTAEGHAVRACYLYAGMADVATETGDEGLVAACKALWSNIVGKRMYVHGGIGSAHIGERFSYDYDLPNEAAYAETCAAIALAFFAQRMFLLEQSGGYIDVLERALYNGIISGVSLDGKRFFYDNYLASHPGYHKFQKRSAPDRQEWFGCACCPPNLARLVASLGNYLFATSDSDLWLNLYAQYDATADVAGGVRFQMKTRYPWDGSVSVTLNPGSPSRFRVHLRIPAWCGGYTVAVNGTGLQAETESGYVVLDREWHDGDTIELVFEMPIERITAHPSVRQASGRIALQRGPVLYCLEEADNGKDLNNLYIPKDSELEWEFDGELLGGVGVIKGTGVSRAYEGWDGTLYRPGDQEYEERSFTAVPYHAWNNRGVGEMLVWINEATGLSR